MGDVSSWLRGQRKYELVELAEAAGLSNYENLKKFDLEVALDEYLRANEVSLSKHSVFNPFYTRQRSAGSPTKPEGTGSGSGVARFQGEARSVKTRTRRVTKAADEIAQTVATMATQIPHTGEALVDAIPLPPSPAAVADAIDNSTAELRSKMDDIWEEARLWDRAETLRDHLSSVVSIETAILAIEALGLRSQVLPLRYAFTVPPVAGFTSSAWPVHLPDLFLLVTTSFWSPVTLWVFTSFAIPLAFAYFFNLTLRAKHAHSSAKVHFAIQPTHQVDPLTFNVVKALVAYLVYSHDASFGRLFVAQETVDAVRTAVPGGLDGLFIGSAIGALASIYEAILKN